MEPATTTLQTSVQIGSPGFPESFFFLPIVLGILAIVACVVIGAFLGKKFRGEPILGGILGFFGAVGFIVIMLLPDRRLSEGQDQCPLCGSRKAENHQTEDSSA